MQSKCKNKNKFVKNIHNVKLSEMKGYWQAFVDLIYPPVCKACGEILADGEQTLCTRCRVHLPYTRYERWKGNPTARSFYGRVPLRGAAALLFFTPEGRVQQLLHELKYHRRPEIGHYLGAVMGRKLSASPLYAGVDYIVPVPLHPKKEKKRGYNQALLLGQGMVGAWKGCAACGVASADGVAAPTCGGSTSPQLLTNLLYKRRLNESQTRKNRVARLDNVQEVYWVNKAPDVRSRVAGRHLLLVDDVVTTGATLESAASAILAVYPDVKLSVVAAATPI